MFAKCGNNRFAHEFETIARLVFSVKKSSETIIFVNLLRCAETISKKTRTRAIACPILNLFTLPEAFSIVMLYSVKQTPVVRT